MMFAGIRKVAMRCSSVSEVRAETEPRRAVQRLVMRSQPLLTVADGPLDNPLAQHREIWLRDLDGYVVVVASTYGTI
jgi:hypothetical protein